MLHHPPDAERGAGGDVTRAAMTSPVHDDDDRSAVTIWLPRSGVRREALAKTLERMAAEVRNAKPETGLDFSRFGCSRCRARTRNTR